MSTVNKLNLWKEKKNILKKKIQQRRKNENKNVKHLMFFMCYTITKY